MKPIPLKFHGPEHDAACAEYEMKGPKVSELCAQIDRDWREKAVDAVRRALLNTELAGGFDVSTLSEDEKFAICYMAGVPVEPSHDEFPEFKLRTVPCGITWTGKRFNVLIAPQSED